MPSGTVLLLREIQHADGQAHAYVFQAHPGWPANEQIDVVFHAEDFAHWWEPEWDADAIRERELAEVAKAMEDTKAKMLEQPPKAAPAGLLEHLPNAAQGHSKALATRAGVANLVAYAEQMKEDATARSNWIRKHSELLGEHGATLARFHAERATALMAKAQSQLDGVEDILTTAGNLALYTGQDVQVMNLREGAPAAPEARVTIYQEVLAFDEETLLFVDDGGLDHRDVDELRKALADPLLVERMIPSERGVVLCRFRENHKEFVGGDSVAAAVTNAHLNAAAQQEMLLVRDGERLDLVQAPKVFSGLRQMMPSKEEQDSHFRRRTWGGSEPITADDLDYVDAKRRQMHNLDRYTQTLIILWGLRDRGEIFADSALPAFSSWLDPGFQNAYMDLVSLDTMVEHERPDFESWAEEQNSYMAPGCWVAVRASASVTERWLPAAFAGAATHPVYTPNLPAGQAVAVGRAKSDRRGLYLMVPLVYSGYGYNVQRQTMNARLYVAIRDEGALTNPHALVIDRATASDLHYYLTSRKQRRRYSSYVTLFREAHAWVSRRDEDEQALRAGLMRAVREAALEHDPDTLDAVVVEAMAVARAAQRGSRVPGKGTPAFRRFVNAARNIVHARLADNSMRVEAIRTWAQENRREPLRLVLSGRDKWWLYLAPLPEEHDARLGKPFHVTKAQVRFEGSSPVVTIEGRERLKAQAGELIVHDWPQARRWCGEKPLFGLSYRQAREVLDLLVDESDKAAGDDLEQVAEKAITHMRNSPGRLVSRMMMAVPVGTSIDCNGKPWIVVMSTDALEYLYTVLPEPWQHTIKEQTRRIYAKPQHRLDRLGQSKWSLSLLTLNRTWEMRNRWDEWSATMGTLAGWVTRAGEAAVPGRQRLTSVTPFAVGKMPELARIAESQAMHSPERACEAEETL